MYKIYADGTLIYDSTLEDYHISKGQITKEADKSGSFVFSLHPSHFYYDSFVQLKTVVTVYKDSRIVFRGRVLNYKADYWNNKELTCEGELGFFQDSIIRPYSVTGTPAEVFTKFVNEHNAQVDEFKRFKIGTVTVTDPNGRIARDNTGYETTLTNLTSRLLEDATGGHFYVTHGDDGRDLIPTIHYVADFPVTAPQVIEFGSNLRDYAKTVSAEDIATAIIPLGATINDGNSETSDPRLTIASVNDGQDYIHSPEAVALRGWIVKAVEWDDITEPANLLSRAREYLATVVNQAVTLELKAIDLHLLDRSIASYNVCEYVHVVSRPHNFAAVMLCNKQTIDLLKPENDSLVLGHTFYTFTESQARTVSNLRRIETKTVATLNKALVNIVTRLDALEGVTFVVVVTDSRNAADALLSSVGQLVVAGQTIASARVDVTTNSRSVTVEYTLKSNISTARTVVVNGQTLGTVSAAGDTVTTTVAVSSGSELTINFT